MRCSLALAALAATFTVGSSQFHFLQRRQGGDSVSSSFFSSSSWVRGQDGLMHQQTKTSSTQFNKDGSQTKKRTACRDGECGEVVEVFESPNFQPMRHPDFQPMMQEPPRLFSGGPMQPQSPPFAHLRGVLDRMFGRMQQMHQQQPEILIDPTRVVAQRKQPEMIVIEPMRNQPEIIIEEMPPMRPFRQISIDNPQDQFQREIIAVPFKEYRPQVQQPKAATAPASDMRLIKVGVALFALSAAYAMVLSVLKCWRADRTSARERPLRELGEPLAPAPVNVAIPAAATGSARKFNPLRTYLSDLYTRAGAKTEARGVTKYLAGLYERVVA